MLVLVMLASVSVSGSHDVDNTPVDDLYEEVLAKKLSIEAMPPAPSEAAARRKTHRSVHATNATTVLIVFINNPTSIDARTKHPDPRFVSLSSTACELVRLGHNVLVEVAGGLSIRPSLAKTQISQLACKHVKWVSTASLKLYGRPSVVVAWFAYFDDKGTRRNPLVSEILNEPSVPARLWYENGMTRGAVTLDPKGFLGRDQPTPGNPFPPDARQMRTAIRRSPAPSALPAAPPRCPGPNDGSHQNRVGHQVCEVRGQIDWP